jgi:hypothetical protein
MWSSVRSGNGIGGPAVAELAELVESAELECVPETAARSLRRASGRKPGKQGRGAGVPFTATAGTG